ncbi:unnamed protein product [Ectocarpus sp. 8 AP-2014]
MLAYAAKAVLGEKRFEASEAAVEWTGARDGSGRAFWYNGVTHEATLEDPSKDGSYASPSSLSLPSQLQQRQSASPVAVTPFRSGCRTPGDGCVTPAECGRVTPPFYGCTAPPAAADYPVSGYASPPYNGYVSPPVMTPPHVRGYFSPGTGGVSPPYGHRLDQQQQQPPLPLPDQHAYPMENQSPCFAAGQAWESVPRQPRRARRQRRSDASIPPSTATAGGGGGGGGYRWDECYKETDGKKFWRHKETGVIITEDPYH